ncbi:hypothetical protein MMC26_000168 [Xylographa opegraphella]|nr:hypothetical protein [Xylographa opegraphella]
MTDATTPEYRYTIADSQSFTNDPSLVRSPDYYCSAAACTIARDLDTCDKRESKRRVSQVRSPCIISGRASRTFVTEIFDGLAQSFLELPLHYTSSKQQPNQSIHDLTSTTRGCECCCRCGRSGDKRSDGAKVVRKSRSYSPLRTSISELSGWTSQPISTAGTAKAGQIKSSGPGEAPLERLPVEILEKIIAQLSLEIPAQEYAPRNADLIACLRTSRTLYGSTVSVLYSHVTIPHSLIFSKFLEQLVEYPTLGSIVKRLDLSHFTSIGMGRTRQSNHELQNMTSSTLLKCLSLTPNIQEVLLQEHLHDDIDEAVLRKLFFGLTNLQALDFCGSSSGSFVDAFFVSLVPPTIQDSTMLSLRRLSLHECFTLPSSVYEHLLPRLPRLTHLDLFHTRVNNRALMSIPATAGLTHLNLGRCNHITGTGVVDFLTSHSATLGLVYLNLACDTSRYRLLWEADVETILRNLPSTLKSLNMSGAKILPSHAPLLLPLTKHLEELGIGFTELTMKEINSLFIPEPLSYDEKEVLDVETNWMPSTLRYIDLSGIPAVTQCSLFSNSCVLLYSVTSPLEVIELGERDIAALSKCSSTNKKLGWVAKGLGRRGWYVREPTGDNQVGSRGRRDWKMGAMWWGMRKVPMAFAEVGGLYGHYMFKK